MFKLKFIDDNDNLSIKDFDTKLELNEYIKSNSVDRAWHQIEEIKKVIPNLKED